MWMKKKRPLHAILLAMDPRRNKGQAFLAMVLFIGAIVAIVGLLIAFLATSFIDTGYGLSASASAEAAASSGAEDAMLRLDRSPHFSSSGYPFVVGSSTAMVAVTQGSPSAGYITILSNASVSGHEKNIQVILFENASTTQLSVVSWQDIQ